MGEEDVGDEHYQTPEEAEDVHVEEAEEGKKQDVDMQLTKEGLEHVHKAMDANGDGKVGIQEIIDFGLRVRKHTAVKYSKTDLEDIDKSKDGKVSLEEYFKSLGLSAPGAKEDFDKEQRETEAGKFRAADDNGDGLLDGNELYQIFYPEFSPKVRAAEATAQLKNLDTNGDGKLSKKEFFGIEEAEDLEAEEAGGDLHQEDFSKFDADKDGHLNVEELIAHQSSDHIIHEEYDKIIEIADMDGDGQVTAQELRKAKSLLEGSDAEMHLLDWVQHHGEL